MPAKYANLTLPVGVLGAKSLVTVARSWTEVPAGTTRPTHEGLAQGAGLWSG